MKRYIRSTTKVKHDAKDAAKLVIDYLTSLGLEGVRKEAARKAGHTGAQVCFTIGYEFYDDDAIQQHVEWLTKMYPEEYSYESALEWMTNTVAPGKNEAYHNFEVLSDLYGANNEGSYHDPISHRGSEYDGMTKAVVQDVIEFLATQGYSDAIVERHAFGFYGKYQTVEINIFVPKQV